MHSLTLIVPSSSVQNSTGPATAGRSFVPIALALALAWFTVPPTAWAADGDLGYHNTAEGFNALAHLTTGVAVDNTAIGFLALGDDTTGSDNTASGAGALNVNTTGNNNTASGSGALNSNTSGNDNTANGNIALSNNTTGIDNTASGSRALVTNKTGNFNTASGFEALFSNDSGSGNTASGLNALFKNIDGSDNTANGVNTLYNNTSADNNTAAGYAALYSNIGGNNNTANGTDALVNNTNGSSNTGEGANALFANNSGSNNTALGFNAGNKLTTGSNNIDIGANVPGVAGEANTVRIGKQGTQKQTFIAGISGVGVTGSQVFVSSSGKLGIMTSSARFKEAVKPMDRASEAILALKPVSFRYKEQIDPNGIPQFGLVAEEVEKVNPDLVVRNEDGKVSTVRYEAVNAMLLNEFLKEHCKVTELTAIVAKQEATNAQQQKQIEALAVGLQRVTAQLESVKPASRIAIND